MRRSVTFWIGAIAFLVIILLMTQIIGNEYPFFAGYVILQFVVLNGAIRIAIVMMMALISVLCDSPIGQDQLTFY